MAWLRCLIVAGIWVALTAGVASAAEASTMRCLSESQQRAAVSSGKAVALAKAMGTSKRRSPGEVVRARLCQGQNGGLVYVLTVLSRNGKVTRTVIDAANGAVAGEQ